MAGSEGRASEEYDCPQVREMASDYIEADLQTGVMASLRRHLEACENCAAFVNTLRRTIDLVKGMPLARAPESVKKSILDAVSRQGR